MTRSSRALSDKSTTVRSYRDEEPRRSRHGGRTARLLARCPISRRIRHRSAPAKPVAATVSAGTGSGRDRLIVGILTLIAVGYGVALVSRIVAQYGL